jgi:hypothetical protein
LGLVEGEDVLDRLDFEDDFAVDDDVGSIAVVGQYAIVV